MEYLRRERERGKRNGEMDVESCISRKAGV